MQADKRDDNIDPIRLGDIDFLLMLLSMIERARKVAKNTDRNLN